MVWVHDGSFTRWGAGSSAMGFPLFWHRPHHAVPHGSHTFVPLSPGLSPRSAQRSTPTVP